jgi:hypothetical protein
LCFSLIDFFHLYTFVFLFLVPLEIKERTSKAYLWACPNEKRIRTRQHSVECPTTALSILGRYVKHFGIWTKINFLPPLLYKLQGIRKERGHWLWALLKACFVNDLDLRKPSSNCWCLRYEFAFWVAGWLAGRYITSFSVQRKSEGPEGRFLKGKRENMGSRKRRI